MFYKVLYFTDSFYSVWTWIQHWFFKKLCGTTCYPSFLLEMPSKPLDLRARSLFTVSVDWWASCSLRLLLSTNLAPPPLDHFQRLCVNLYSKMLCSALASCAVEGGQVWVQTGNGLTLKHCPTISIALTAQASPALVLLPLQYCFGNWLYFPNSHVCT